MIKKIVYGIGENKDVDIIFTHPQKVVGLSEHSLVIAYEITKLCISARVPLIYFYTNDEKYHIFAASHIQNIEIGYYPNQIIF